MIFALLGLCAISLRLAWGVSGEFPLNLGTTAFAQQGGCRTVTHLDGHGSQQSEPFEISGQTFRVNFEADNPGETPGFAFFNVLDENDGVVQPDSQDLSQDDPDHVKGSATFSSGPGSYTIEIASQSADYTIDVEDCGASAPRSTNQPNPSRAKQDNDPPSTNQRGAARGAQGSKDRELLKAGGPADGLVPVMPDGGCPAEYPIEQDGACHR